MSPMLLPLLMAMAGLAQDTVTVVADNPPLLGDELELIEEVRIGELAGSEEYLFGQVWHLAASPDGTVYVADRQGPEIRMFDPAGGFVRRIGGVGEGPGEYESVLGLCVLSDGRLSVWDPSLTRVSTYTRDGEPDLSFRVGLMSMFGGRETPLRCDVQDRLYVPTMAELPSRGQRVNEWNVTWIRFTSDGELVDSVSPPRRRLEGVFAGAPTKSGVRSPFKINTYSTLAPDGSIVSGRTDAYVIHKTAAEGPVLRVERSYEPVVVGRDERREWGEVSRVWDERWGTNSPDIPDRKPPFQRLFVDVDGRIWVQRSVDALEDPEFRDETADRNDWPPVHWYEIETYDVLSSEGAYLGTVELPERSTLMYARGDAVWGVLRGDYDEQYVVRYRLEGSRP